MSIKNEKEIEGAKLDDDKMKNVLKRVLIGPEDGFKGYYMRSFELGPGGYTPEHKHDWPHIFYVVSGRGIIRINGKDNFAIEGTHGFIPSNELHQFLNNDEVPLKFICIVPEKGENQ